MVERIGKLVKLMWETNPEWSLRLSLPSADFKVLLAELKAEASLTTINLDYGETTVIVTKR